MFEVFFTTIIICTLTALVILTTGVMDTTDYIGSALSIAAYNSVIPGIGGVGVTLATVLFATSTTLGWAFTMVKKR